jgi:hypothetical protein
MLANRFSRIHITLLPVQMIVGIVLAGMSASAAAQTEKVLFNFIDGQPVAGAIFDSSGDLYTTSSTGGNTNQGAVWEFVPGANGVWAPIILHNFGILPNDGIFPYAGVTMDSSGNLYGTAYTGFGSGTWGIVYELIAEPGGGWTYSILHNFGAPGDGQSPDGGVTLDAAGNLYGTTNVGGSGSQGSGYGTVFELSPDGAGGWTERILHRFQDNGKDGEWPFGNLVLDAEGDIYGVTNGGGEYAAGTVFELMPSADGQWTEKILYSFGASATDARDPAGIILDGSGRLFGTTTEGGDHGYGRTLRGYGTVFELSQSTTGDWEETILYNFNRFTPAGSYPYAGPILDSAGNLYGTNYDGGQYLAGTAWELSPTTQGEWTVTTLHDFGAPYDGSEPSAPLAFDGNGNLFGTTLGGPQGSSGGVLFEITP